MKRITYVALALALVCGALAAPEAGAGWLRKNTSDRTEKPEWMKQAQRYNGPVMSFHSGVLQQDGWTGWKLGETTVHFIEGCTISTADGEEGTLDAGSEVVIMGSRFGDTIMATSVRIKKPDFAFSGGRGPEVRVQVSDMNPNCGEVKQAPR